MLLEDASGGIRRKAAFALEYILAGEAGGPLIQCLSDESSGVRSEAARTLGKRKERRVVGPLIAALDDADTSVIKGAIQALGYIGDQRATWPISAHLASSQLNYSAARALRKLHWVPKSDADIVYLSVAEENAEQLKHDWKRTQKVLLPDLESPQYHTVENALVAFIGIGDANILPILIDVLNAKGNKTMAEAYLNCGHSAC